MNIPIKINLDHDKDKDIISFFETMSSNARNKLLKDLVRTHMIGDRQTVFGILARIEQKLNSVAITSTISGNNNEVSEYQDDFFPKDFSEVEANLRQLGV